LRDVAAELEAAGKPWRKPAWATSTRVPKWATKKKTTGAKRPRKI